MMTEHPGVIAGGRSHSGWGEPPVSVLIVLSHFSRIEEHTNVPGFSIGATVVRTASCTVLTGRAPFSGVKKGHLFLILPLHSPDRLQPVLALFYDPVCQSPDLQVLKCYLPVVGDEQDPVIGNGFLTIGCPDAQVVRFKADVGTTYSRPVVVRALVTVPDPDFADVVPVIMPVLLQESMAG
jgi:hypothetical protein